ncbi:MAG: helix-turn-helix domain-containing protein [Candidatus Hodarchaeales archaeon]
MSTLKSWFDVLSEEYKDDFDFRFEYLLLNLTEQIVKIMREKNITRTNFAQRLNVSPTAVTKILRGNSNFTLRTLLAIADALGRRLEINFVEENKRIKEVKRNEK